jgi:hypothetical protein
MKEETYIEQISHIHQILAQRTKFNALSGLSGILAGVYALIGSAIAARIIYRSDTLLYNDFKSGVGSDGIVALWIVAFVVLIASIGTGLYFSYKKAKANGELLFNQAGKKVIKEFALFMVTAGIILIILYSKGYLYLLSPMCLIMYGLAHIHIASFINSEVRSLGLAILMIGLVSLLFPGYGLVAWTLGFGVMHIVYGFLMWYKYERA